MAEILAPAGERTRIFRRFSSSLVQAIRIDVATVGGSAEVSGLLEVRGSRWLMARSPETRPLRPSMTVRKGYWDTRFAIYVIPDTDVVVTVHRPRLGRRAPVS